MQSYSHNPPSNLMVGKNILEGKYHRLRTKLRNNYYSIVKTIDPIATSKSLTHDEISKFKRSFQKPIITKIKSKKKRLNEYYFFAENFLKLHGSETREAKRYIIQCLLLANSHHLFKVSLQPDTAASSVGHYIVYIKVPTLKEKFPLLYEFTQKVGQKNLYKTIAEDYIDDMKKGQTQKRTAYNRKFHDKISDPNIRQVIQEEKLEEFAICISPKAHTRQQQDLSQAYNGLATKVINTSSIFYDKETKRIVAIFIKNKIVAPPSLIKNIDKLPANAWTHRYESQKREAEETSNKKLGGAAQFGLFAFNFVNQFSKPTKTHKHALDNLTSLLVSTTDIYEKMLPTTFKAAMRSTAKSRTQMPFLSEKSPFSSITINAKFKMKPHRDGNRHNFSAMTVLEKTQDQTTTTCFPEWEVEDDKKSMPAFLVKEGDLLLADFDYLHYIPENKTQEIERYSILMYNAKNLFMQPKLECGESDLDSTTYNESNKQTDSDATETDASDDELSLPLTSTTYAESASVVNELSSEQQAALTLNEIRQANAQPAHPHMFFPSTANPIAAAAGYQADTENENSPNKKSHLNKNNLRT